MAVVAKDAKDKGRHKKQQELVSAVAARIVQMAVKADVSLADLGRVAESDPAFALRVLALVNSPAFGLAQKISNAPLAVSMLGIRGLRNLALSLTLSDMVPLGQDGELLLAISLRRAVASRMIADAIGEKQTDEYFTTGLFLEAGILARAKADLGGAVASARVPAASRAALEKARGEMPHPARGAEVAASYQLPSDVVNAIRKHHDEQPPEAKIARVAWCAERIAGVFEGGDLRKSQAAAIQALGQLKLSENVIDRILRDLPGKVAACGPAFEREIGEQENVDDIVQNAHRSLVELNSNYEATIRELERVVREKDQLTQQLQDANVRLERLAATDGLTNLMNKRTFLEALRRDLARADRGEQWLSLVVADIDHFKKFNDTYGHQTGDEVLKHVAKLYNQAVRTGDIPARYGGEEFVIILPQTDPDGALVVAERLRAMIETTPLASGHGPLQVTSSFGVAAVKGPGCTGKSVELIEKADEALYQAKHAGRNRVVCIREPVNAPAANQQA